jgi:hypothetical protein
LGPKRNVAADDDDEVTDDGMAKARPRLLLHPPPPPRRGGSGTLSNSNLSGRIVICPLLLLIQIIKITISR